MSPPEPEAERGTNDEKAAVTPVSSSPPLPKEADISEAIAETTGSDEQTKKNADDTTTEKKPRKRRRGRKPDPNKFIDLTGVPAQPPILKNDLGLGNTQYNDNSRHHPVKEGSSKYTGVYYEKTSRKWKAQIMVEGSVRSIGYYDEEEEAAADYARAAYKYKSKEGKERSLYGGLHLNDIPDQPLIRNGGVTGYKGVKKCKSRWQASIGINGKRKTLGTFDTIEEAAGIYAKAEFKLKQQGLQKFREARNQPKGEGDTVDSMPNEKESDRCDVARQEHHTSDDESTKVTVAILVGASERIPDCDNFSGEVVAV